MLARGMFRRHLDGSEMLLEWPLLLTPTAREYGHSQRSKAGHGSRRDCNTHRKMMDHGPQPGSADRLPAPDPWRHCGLLVFDDWLANRARKPRDRWLACPQWPFFQQM